MAAFSEEFLIENDFEAVLATPCSLLLSLTEKAQSTFLTMW